MLGPEVNNQFKSILKITESIENSNEEFKTDKRTFGNNPHGNNIVSTNINGNSFTKISKGD